LAPELNWQDLVSIILQAFGLTGWETNSPHCPLLKQLLHTDRRRNQLPDPQGH